MAPGKSKQHAQPQAATTFGGVIIDARQQILLREPAGHFGGYVWTFAKGHPESGESPEQTALREVREELGVEAGIVKPIPGIFGGDTSTAQFFLMRYVREVDEPCPETSDKRWVSFDEARSLIQQTRTPTGRQRDLDVLAAVETLLGNSPQDA
jgi:8-oxo-dGTP pyrophosphatase MutT (NUDIX family)